MVIDQCYKKVKKDLKIKNVRNEIGRFKTKSDHFETTKFSKRATIYYLFATQQTYYNQIKIYNCKLLRYVQASQSNLFTLKT